MMLVCFSNSHRLGMCVHLQQSELILREIVPVFAERAIVALSVSCILVGQCIIEIDHNVIGIKMMWTKRYQQDVKPEVGNRLPVCATMCYWLGCLPICFLSYV